MLDITTRTYAGLGIALLSLHTNNAVVSAFTTLAPNTIRPITPIHSSTLFSSESTDTILRTRDEIISLARLLSSSSETGPFLSSFNDNEDRDELERLVAELEALVSSKPFGETEKQAIVGDWELLCTSTSFSSSNSRKNKKSLPSIASLFPFLPKPAPIQNSVTVFQRIRTSNDDNDDSTINRVDNVIEFIPPNSLQDILPDAPIDIDLPNPFEVTETKIALVHDAEVQSVSPVLRTKIGLKSVVLNVAGTSQYLEPSGSDVLGVNVPMLKSAMESMSNAGSFDTTYVDETLRISRGKNTGGNGSGIGFGFGETLRVFVRSGGGGAVGGSESWWTKEEEEEVVPDEVDVTKEETNDEVVAEVVTEVEEDVATESVEEEVEEAVVDSVEEEDEVVAEAVEEEDEAVAEAVEEEDEAVAEAVEEEDEVVAEVVEEDEEEVVTEDITEEKKADDAQS